MKKLLFILSALGLIATGLTTASAQYYTASASYPTAASYYYQQPYSSAYYASYGSGIGSYTIGCTTYYYNTSTGAQLYTQNICTQHTDTYYTTYPASYTYPTYSYPTHNQYCTWGARNGQWYPCQTFSWFDNDYYDGHQNYLNCYYDWRGQYICW